MLTLTVGGAAIIARTAYVGMREALGQEHIRTLRAVGTPEWRIRYLHALRFASVPGRLGARHPVHRPVRRLGDHREPSSRWPGSARPARSAALSHDFPALIGVVVVATVVVVITNLLLDLLVAALDPKVRRMSEPSCSRCRAS